MVSTEPVVAALPGGRDVATQSNLSQFERLAALFELGAERAAIAVGTTRGLSGLPGLAGALARRWEFVAVDLTCDGDPYADLTELPRARLLLGLSLLSKERMCECLGRLNRGRDRIHALGLHIVLLIDEVDLRPLHEFAPDFASRVHEMLGFDADEFVPARAGVLSPLGPIRRPEPHDASPQEPRLLSDLSHIAAREELTAEPAEMGAAAASLAWSFATSEQTRVAWIERERWDDERSNEWLREFDDVRLLVVFGGDEEFDAASHLSSVLWSKHPGPVTAEQAWIELTPDIVARADGEDQPSRRRVTAGGVVWLIHAHEDRAMGIDLAHAIEERSIVVVRCEDLIAARLHAATAADTAIVLLSPAALLSREITEALELLRPHDDQQLSFRSFVVLDHVSRATARERVGFNATLLTLRSLSKTVDKIEWNLRVRYSAHTLRALMVVTRSQGLGRLRQSEIVGAMRTNPALSFELLTPLAPGQFVEEIHHYHTPFQILHVAANAYYDDGQTYLMLNSRISLSLLAWELRFRNLGLCILDLLWVSSDTVPSPNHQALELLIAGVQSVIVMSPSMTMNDHGKFTSTLYKSIAEGAAIEHAMEVARATLSAQTRDPDTAPMLFALNQRSPQSLVPVLEPSSPASMDRISPTVVHGFVGRYPEWRELDQALREHASVVVYGIGDKVGKTMLADELTRWQQMRRFDYVVWLPPRDAPSAVTLLATTLLPGWDGDEALLRKVLGVRDVLIVLDQWPESSAYGVVEQFAEFDRIRFLITAHERPPERTGWYTLELTNPWASVTNSGTGKVEDAD